MIQFKAPYRNWMPAVDKMSMYEDHSFPVPCNFFDDYEGRRAAKEQKMSIEKSMNLGGDLKLFGYKNTEMGETLDNELNRMTPAQRAVLYKVYLPIKDSFNLYIKTLLSGYKSKIVN
jgi:hypothetical protein